MNDKLKVLYILQKFKEAKKDVNTIALNKLLYACELKSVDDYGKRFTEYKIKHYKHGPFIQALYDVIKEYSDSGSNEDKNIKIKDDLDNVSISLFSEDEQKVLEEVTSKWIKRASNGRMTGNPLNGLINYAYMTEPLLDTPFNEEIDLLKYGKGSEISKVLTNSENIKRVKRNVIKHKDVLKRFLDSVDAK